MENRCFICSLPRTTFDNVTNGFIDHKLKEHNMWNYLYFVYNVRFRKPEKLMGIELYVWEQKSDNSVNWLPLSRSSRLSSTPEEIMDEKLRRAHQKLNNLRRLVESQTAA